MYLVFYNVKKQSYKLKVFNEIASLFHIRNELCYFSFYKNNKFIEKINKYKIKLLRQQHKNNILKI